jgi:predicted nucleic acid-binding protein
VPTVTLAFWDSSAFVKLLIDEAGSDDVEALWNDPGPTAASRLVVPEVSAALAAARRSGRLDEPSHRAAQREWSRYRHEVDFVELSATLADRAAALVPKHDLSCADAVHLATALELRERPMVIASWDRRLAAAAVAVGFVVVPGPDRRASSAAQSA